MKQDRTITFILKEEDELNLKFVMNRENATQSVATRIALREYKKQAELIKQLKSINEKQDKSLELLNQIISNNFN